MSYINELMSTEQENTIIDDSGNQYIIRVLGSGNDLFFRENDKGLICSIDAVNAVIYTQSIKTWDSTGTKMNKEERKRVIGLIEECYKKVYNPNVNLD